MQIHQLKPIKKKKFSKRIGRGGKKGTYAGRGIKGQKSRAGRKPRVGFAGGDTLLIKRLPKRRGQRGKLNLKKGVKISRLKNKPKIINLEDIEKKFKTKEVVSPSSLLKKGLIVKIKGRIPRVKILGKGEIKKQLEFKGIIFSKSVQEKIKKIKGAKNKKIKPKVKKKKT